MGGWIGNGRDGRSGGRFDRHTVSGRAIHRANTKSHSRAAPPHSRVRPQHTHISSTRLRPTFSTPTRPPLFVLHHTLKAGRCQSRASVTVVLVSALLRPSVSDEDGRREGGTVIADTAATARISEQPQPDELQRQLDASERLTFATTSAGLPGALPTRRSTTTNICGPSRHEGACLSADGVSDAQPTSGCARLNSGRPCAAALWARRSSCVARGLLRTFGGRRRRSGNNGGGNRGCGGGGTARSDLRLRLGGDEERALSSKGRVTRPVSRRPIAAAVSSLPCSRRSRAATAAAVAASNADGRGSGSRCRLAR